MVCSICLAYSSADTQIEMQYIRQLVGKTAAERTIVWQSDAVDESTVLEYQRAGDSAVNTVRPMIERCEVEGAVFFRYRTDIAGLSCNVPYEYRIVSRGRRSEWRQLTVKTDEYTAVIFTDSQCAGDYRVWADIVRAASVREENRSLCLHLGDLVDCGASQYQWDRWLAGAGDLLAECAFAPTIGNHEDYTKEWQMSLPHYYRALFPAIKAGDEVLEGHVYSFDYGDVHYAVLDTQSEELASWKDAWTARQAEWLKRDLAHTRAKWKVVLCHKSFYDMDGTITEHGKVWLPICQAYGVQLILSGHHHIYSREAVDGITMITAGVSGDGTGYAPQERRDVVAIQCDIPCYLTMKVTDDALALRAIQTDGKVMDEVTIRCR